MRRHGTANVFPRMAVPPFSQGLGFPWVSVREISGVGEADARGQHEFLVPPPCLVSRPRLLHGPDHGGLGPDLAPGEVAEWLNAPHSKCGIGASLSGVRIPPSPPYRALSSPLTLFKSQTSAMSMLAVPMMTGPQPGLRKKAKQGMRSYPVGTIASTVPIAGGALKVVVSFIRTDGSRARTAPLVFRNWRCLDRQQDSCRNSCASAPVFGPLGGHGGWNHWLPARGGHRLSFWRGLSSMPVLERA
jgi:hypothetical protein